MGAWQAFQGLIIRGATTMAVAIAPTVAAASSSRDGVEAESEAAQESMASVVPSQAVDPSTTEQFAMSHNSGGSAATPESLDPNVSVFSLRPPPSSGQAEDTSACQTPEPAEGRTAQLPRETMEKYMNDAVRATAIYLEARTAHELEDLVQDAEDAVHGGHEVEDQGQGAEDTAPGEGEQEAGKEEAAQKTAHEQLQEEAGGFAMKEGAAAEAAAQEVERATQADAQAAEEAAAHDLALRGMQEEHAQRRNQDQAPEEEAAAQASLLEALRVATEQKSIQERIEGSEAEEAKAIEHRKTIDAQARAATDEAEDAPRQKTTPPLDASGQDNSDPFDLT